MGSASKDPLKAGVEQEGVWCVSKVERQAGELASVLEAAEGFSRLHVAQRGITARKVLISHLRALNCFHAATSD